MGGLCFVSLLSAWLFYLKSKQPQQIIYKSEKLPHSLPGTQLHNECSMSPSAYTFTKSSRSASGRRGSGSIKSLKSLGALNTIQNHHSGDEGSSSESDELYQNVTNKIVDCDDAFLDDGLELLEEKEEFYLQDHGRNPSL